MLKRLAVTTAMIAFGATSALACGYKSQETAQTPAPVQTSQAPQSPIPADVKLDVAEAPKAPKTETKTN